MKGLTASRPAHLIPRAQLPGRVPQEGADNLHVPAADGQVERSLTLLGVLGAAWMKGRAIV